MDVEAGTQQSPTHHVSCGCRYLHATDTTTVPSANGEAPSDLAA